MLKELLGLKSSPKTHKPYHYTSFILRCKNCGSECIHAPPTHTMLEELDKIIDGKYPLNVGTLAYKSSYINLTRGR